MLLAGVRGSGKQPGELRRSQNWIGGRARNKAVFVPPPAERVPALLADVERFIHSRAEAICRRWSGLRWFTPIRDHPPVS